MRKFITLASATAFVLVTSIGIYYYFFVSTKATAVKAPHTETTDIFKEVTATQAAKNVKDTNELKVTIASPKESIVLTQNPTIKIAGATKRNAVYTVLGSKRLMMSEVNQDESFAPNVELLEGINTIVLQVFDQNGGKEEITRTIVYLKDAILDGHAITTGIFKLEELSVSKQTKIYQFTNGVKKILRTTSQLNEQLPITIIHEKENTENTIAILQQTGNQERPLVVHGKVINKAVVEESFAIEIAPLDKTEAKELVVDADSVITKLGDNNQTLRGTDIKIGDRVVAIVKDIDSQTATQVLIIPGQAAGILKDVKQD